MADIPTDAICRSPMESKLNSQRLDGLSTSRNLTKINLSHCPLSNSLNKSPINGACYSDVRHQLPSRNSKLMTSVLRSSSSSLDSQSPQSSITPLKTSVRRRIPKNISAEHLHHQLSHHHSHHRQSNGYRAGSPSVWVPRCSSGQMLFLLLPPMLLLLMPDLGIASMCIERFSCETGEQKRVVKCVDPEIDVVPMCLSPSLLQLSLHSTKIHALYLVSLRFYTDLRHVNLSDNEINYIEARSFECQPNLEELHLASNKLSGLLPDTFMGLHNLTVLSLQGNLLEEVPDRTFEHLRRLELLDLSRNRIRTIGDSAFYNLPQLRVLHLSDNMLKSIPSKALNHVPHLAELSLGINSFNSISKEDFQPLMSLTSLDLSGAQIGNGIALDSFTTLSGLRLLRLDDCRLESIPTEALRPLERLQQLFLNRNMFKELKPGMLDGNRRLQVLEIIGCPNLERISEDTFKNTLDLRRVIISRNPKLWFIPPGTFRFLTQIKYLDIHANNLQSLQRETAVWNDIPVWLLQDNPLVCNCSVAWLRDELRLTNNTSVPVVCSAPPHLSGTPLANTELTDLSCGIGPATQGLVIGIVVVVALAAVIGVVVFLLCRSSRSSCLRHLMKGSNWNGRGPPGDLRTYPHDYPEYIMATPHKPVPVTEL